MPFFNWALVKSRTLHPDIGIPADDTQGLPYFSSFQVNPFQNFGLSAKTTSGTDSITGFLFTANNRYLLGSGDVKAIDYINDSSSMFAIDSLSGHVFATTTNGLINNPINISGNNLGWNGTQSPPISNGHSQITFFNYLGSNYVGFGASESDNFAIFKPGGIVDYYSNYIAYSCIQPSSFYNGLYSILYGAGYGDKYGFVPLADAPLVYPAFPSESLISYSFTESALILSLSYSDFYGYDGINDPTLASSFIKLGYPVNRVEVFGFDPSTGSLLSISPNTVTVGGHAYYPVYVYNSGIIIYPTPQQYARTVKNYTVNGHLNWRKQR